MDTRFDELVKKLNSLEIIQRNIKWEKDLPEDIYNKYFESIGPIMDGLNVVKHRWYETSISVYEIFDRYLGVRTITDLFSEQSSVEDMYHTIEFFEMEQVLSINYKIKK